MWLPLFGTKDSEKEQFDTAYDQFSRTVLTAAQEHQKTVREAYRSMAETIEAHANEANATWPYFTMPAFENLAHHALIQSNTEVNMIAPLLKQEENDKWFEYTDAHVNDWVFEGHMLQKGSLDRLVDDSNYVSNFTMIANGGIVLDEEAHSRDYNVPW